MFEVLEGDVGIGTDHLLEVIVHGHEVGLAPFPMLRELLVSATDEEPRVLVFVDPSCTSPDFVV